MNAQDFETLAALLKGTSQPLKIELSAGPTGWDCVLNFTSKDGKDRLIFADGATPEAAFADMLSFVRPHV